MVYLRKLMSNIFLLKYYTINYALNFFYIIFNEKFLTGDIYYDIARAINYTSKLTCVCACACTCDSAHLRKQYAIDLQKNQRLVSM